MNLQKFSDSTNSYFSFWTNPGSVATLFLAPMGIVDFFLLLEALLTKMPEPLLEPLELLLVGLVGGSLPLIPRF